MKFLLLLYLAFMAVQAACAGNCTRTNVTVTMYTTFTSLIPYNGTKTASVGILSTYNGTTGIVPITGKLTNPFAGTEVSSETAQTVEVLTTTTIAGYTCTIGKVCTVNGTIIDPTETSLDNNSTVAQATSTLLGHDSVSVGVNASIASTSVAMVASAVSATVEMSSSTASGLVAMNASTVPVSSPVAETVSAAPAATHSPAMSTTTLVPESSATQAQAIQASISRSVRLTSWITSTTTLVMPASGQAEQTDNTTRTVTTTVFICSCSDATTAVSMPNFVNMLSSASVDHASSVSAVASTSSQLKAGLSTGGSTCTFNPVAVATSAAPFDWFNFRPGMSRARASEASMTVEAIIATTIPDSLIVVVTTQTGQPITKTLTTAHVIVTTVNVTVAAGHNGSQVINATSALNSVVNTTSTANTTSEFIPTSHSKTTSLPTAFNSTGLETVLTSDPFYLPPLDTPVGVSSISKITHDDITTSTPFFSGLSPTPSRSRNGNKPSQSIRPLLLTTTTTTAARNHKNAALAHRQVNNPLSFIVTKFKTALKNKNDNNKLKNEIKNKNNFDNDAVATHEKEKEKEKEYEKENENENGDLDMQYVGLSAGFFVFFFFFFLAFASLLALKCV